MNDPIEDTTTSKSNAKWIWIALIVLLGLIAIIWAINPTTGETEAMLERQAEQMDNDADARQDTLEDYPVQSEPLDGQMTDGTTATAPGTMTEGGAPAMDAPVDGAETDDANSTLPGE